MESWLPMNDLTMDTKPKNFGKCECGEYDYRYCRCPPDEETRMIDEQREIWADEDAKAARETRLKNSPECGPRSDMPVDYSARPCSSQYKWLSIRGE